jgi:hypothetical protein
MRGISFVRGAQSACPAAASKSAATTSCLGARVLWWMSSTAAWKASAAVVFTYQDRLVTVWRCSSRVFTAAALRCFSSSSRVTSGTRSSSPYSQALKIPRGR